MSTGPSGSGDPSGRDVATPCRGDEHQSSDTAPHLSLHDTEQNARARLDQLLDRHVHPTRTVSQVRWTVAARIIAGGTTGLIQYDQLLSYSEHRARR